MGRSYTPKYRVEYHDNTMFFNGAPLGPAATMFWPSNLGKPSDAKAEQLRQDMNQSFQPNGANWHVSKACGVIVHIYKLRVIQQRTREQIAVANMPAFEVA